MKVEDVPDEWVDAVYSGLHQKLNGGPYMMPPDVLDDAARAVIAAVAPLIAARERQRCAQIADDQCDPYGADDGFNARAIAAAIRAGDAP